MRVRILKSSAGVADGVCLSHLVPGFVYDLKPITANYLISQGCGEAVPPSEVVPAPFDDPTFFSGLAGGVRVTMPRAEAADRPRAKRKRR